MKALFVFSTIFISTLSLKAEEDHLKNLNSISDNIQSFYSSNEIKKLKEVERSLLNKKTDLEQDSLLIQYFIALANYRLGLLDYENGGTYFQKCLDTNANIIAKSAEYTEAYVLTAACSNTMIRYQPEQTMALSLNSRNALDAAAKIDSQNPRLLLIKGTSAVYTPPQFGGGIDKANQLFTDAITHFKSQNSTEDNPLPKWGFDEAYLWSGMLNSVSGKQEEAISALTQSLEISDSLWVKNTLLPTLKKGDSIGQYFGLQ